MTRRCPADFAVQRYRAERGARELVAAILALYAAWIASR